MPEPGSPPHLLYVAWGFPPSRGGGVYRALATVNAFAEAGFRVTVLTATRETFLTYTGADTSLESLVHPAVDVHRIPFAWPALDPDIRHWSPLRAFLPPVWRKQRTRKDTRDFPEVGYGPWRKPLEQAALEVHAADPVDVVVASANPNVDFAAADVLHQQHGVPYVMDYRDAWMLDVFDGRLLHAEGSRVAELERRLVRDASEVWFVNEPIRAWHRLRYPDAAERMHVVANGFDPAFAPAPRTEAADPARPLRFGYIGTVSTKVPVTEFLAGWTRARAAGAAMAGATTQIWGHLGFYAAANPQLQALLDEHRSQGVEYAGPLAKQRVAEVYETFDALLLILGAGRYVTSGKVYEYLASALPIVSVHDPGNAASDVLRGYPLWFPASDLSPDAIAEALERAAEAARTAGPEVRQQCRDFSVSYSRDLQLAPRIEALGVLCAERASTAAGQAPTTGAGG
jgi:glycosyltransferase involved in cell wall biosynthesis